MQWFLRLAKEFKLPIKIFKYKNVFETLFSDKDNKSISNWFSEAGVN